MEQDIECSWYDVGCSMDWLRDELMQLFLWVYDAILSSIAGVLDLIPVPDFLENLQPITLPSSVSWAIEPFNLDHGVLIIVGAYTARFILRRIPFIG